MVGVIGIVRFQGRFDSGVSERRDMCIIIQRVNGRI